MTDTDNTTFFKWYFEDLLSKGDASRAESFIADNVVFHPLELHGRQAFIDYVSVLRSAFPDLSFTVEDEISTTSRAAARFTMTGTHLGEFRGIPATRRSVKVSGIDFFHLEEARIAAIWVSLDTLDWMQQLGVIALPG